MLYLVSNVKCSKPIPNLRAEEDEIVFLNCATNWEMFRNIPCLKYLYCRAKDHGEEYFIRNEWKGRELSFFNKFKVLEWKRQFDYPQGMEPTTGFWVWHDIKEQGREVVLVNFFPNKDFTTEHWGGHNWKYEQEMLDKSG